MRNSICHTFGATEEEEGEEGQRKPFETEKTNMKTVVDYFVADSKGIRVVIRTWEARWEYVSQPQNRIL